MPGETMAIWKIRKKRRVDKLPCLDVTNKFFLSQHVNTPYKSWTFLQWRNPWGPSSKCSYEKERAHCCVPVTEYTPSGDKTHCFRFDFYSQVQHTVTLGSVGKPLKKGPVLPWGLADCGWSLRSQSKWCDHCCWHLCLAHFQPSQPMKICHAVWTCDYCVAEKSGGQRASGMNWSSLRSGLKSWDDGGRKSVAEASIVLQEVHNQKVNK